MTSITAVMGFLILGLVIIDLITKQPRSAEVLLVLGLLGLLGVGMLLISLVFSMSRKK